LLTSRLEHPGPNDLIVLPVVVSTSFQLTSDSDAQVPCLARGEEVLVPHVFSAGDAPSRPVARRLGDRLGAPLSVRRRSAPDGRGSHGGAAGAALLESAR
jgi:hypothetical protein